MADDDELAMARVDDPPRTSALVSEWSPERESLASIYDVLAALYAVMVKINGGDPPTLQHPRPLTAWQRLEHRRHFEAHRDLVSRLLPGR